MKVAVVKESAPGERRVALVPETVPRLDAGRSRGAGRGRAPATAPGSPTAPTAKAGATIAKTDDLYATADVILTVTRPDAAALARLRAGQAVIGMLSPLIDPALARDLAGAASPPISLDGLPRTLSRTQGMDALTLAGQRGRLQGRADRRRRVRQVLPAADHRGGHGAARQAARARHRRGGPAGDRHRAAARRPGQRLRRAARVQGRGRVARRHVHRADLAGQRGGRGRLRPRAHRRGTPRAAGRADRAHRPARRGDHHRAGARPQAAAARHRGRGAARWPPAR